MPRVLLVEDSSDQALTLRALLESKDWTVDTAENGRVALAAIAREVPHIVVTDLRMPEMDGLGLVRHLAIEHPRVPVVLITAFGNEDVAARALAAGALSYIPKDRAFEDLPETLQRVLDLVSGQQQRVRILAHVAESRQVFDLDNDTALVVPLVRLVEEALEARFGGTHPGQVFRVGVALSEAVTNAMHHGNLEVTSELRERDLAAYRQRIERRRNEAPYRDRRVRVTAELEDSKVRCRVRDEGPGYPAEALRSCTDPSNLVKASGRGLYLISTFMDRVSWNERRTELVMELDLAKPRPEER